ncbi:hypothetical protein W97_01505 [Coniosporium apollinis CBS 100218]|uniref:Auxin efflux carrier n=1 Tax=Coniosporium apollinis (strain CBS 100218) TaxID=1168221 RepID=R7YKE6_CONA1|nr:uncharacterized protein W97_01505 [Coniosporium apollinis CBS 100218]EON62284.1 hypothetical protein W97_01505 [Coniosporium apollinis CBS 100218]
MPFSLHPKSFRLAGTDNDFAFGTPAFFSAAQLPSSAGSALAAMAGRQTQPDFAHLILLVFEAVMEVVCVSLPGYIVARQGMFDAESQKFLANLNTQLFTPCLIFTKLASQLTADKLGELAIIPAIFAAQTMVSWLTAMAVSRAFRFKKRQRYFVIAMAIFGNSNSLPISLVISLSKTISGLHWDKVPGDNDDEVAARGILYLLIFQQLGQLVRWTYGYNILLAPPEKFAEEEAASNARLERGEAHEQQGLLEGVSVGSSVVSSRRPSQENIKHSATDSSHSDYGSGTLTPAKRPQYASSISSSSSASSVPGVLPTPTNGNIYENIPSGSKGWWPRTKRAGLRARNAVARATRAASHSISTRWQKMFNALPSPLQKTLSFVYGIFARFLKGVWAQMNPPLWAMLIAIIVASVPQLQHLFFDRGTFINNSVTRAVQQSGGVAVPLILVVLGANLARNTLPKNDPHQINDPKEERNLITAALLSRMLIPIIVMGPLLAILAKFAPVSIMDDPIFLIVCFLLTGAPSALQLAQICQLNGVYMGAMSRLLFHSYVIWYVILPSTLILVTCALKVVQWAR